MNSFSRAAAADEGDLSLPVGFRFRPTDEELVDYYLKNKVQGTDFHAENIIDEIDILKFEPWDLVKKSLMKPDDENGFFFSQPEYTRQKNTKRSTEAGYWKKTGTDHDIRTRDKRTVIGKKRILIFYIGHSHNSDKTNWVMHEYYIPKAFHPNAYQRDFVLCHLKKNVNKSDRIHTDAATTCDEGEPSTHNASDFENPAAHDMMDILEDYNQPQENLDWLADASNYDHNLLQAAFASNDSGAEFEDDNLLQAAFASNDSGAEFEEFLQTVFVEPDGGVTSDTDMEPFQGRGQAEMHSEVLYGSSQSRRDTGVIFRNQFSRQAASSVNVVPNPRTDRVEIKSVPNPRTDRVEIKSGTSQGAHKPRWQSGPIIDTSADEYYTKEKARRRTYPPQKPKQPAYHRIAADLPQKQTSLTNSSQDTKVAQGKNAEKGMEQTQNRTLSNWKCSFITWRTSPLTTSPPAACISKILLGIYLFWFFVRRVVLYAE